MSINEKDDCQLIEKNYNITENKESAILIWKEEEDYIYKISKTKNNDLRIIIFFYKSEFTLTTSESYATDNVSTLLYLNLSLPDE